MGTIVIKCKFCGQTAAVKNGRLNGSQLYRCKNCNHKFVENGNSLVRMRTPTHVIVAALNMYFDGLSVRKVSSQMNDIFGETSSQVTIWNWIQKYSRLVSNYVETLRPSLSGKYHHDETEIKVDGDGRYLWETLDEDTRFIVAHLISNGRTSENATAIFRQALNKQRPTALFTDGSFAYDDSYNKVFYSRFKASRVEWIRRVGIRARETNNVVERLHGTFKDRYKVMRGLKNDGTAKTLVDGYVTYYNFCRKHQLIGKTPAQAAGLAIKGGWNELLEKAQIHETHSNSDAKVMTKEISVGK